VSVGEADAADAVLCSPWTLAQEVDPCGTAGTYDQFLLVEIPQPWSPDVGAMPELAPVLGAAPRGTRVLAVVPEEAGLATRVTRWWRSAGGPGFVGEDHLVPTGRLGDALLQLIAGDESASVERAEAPADLLLCSHGRRDRCCGSFGVRLFEECRDRWPPVRVRRCSHTGGHRFAPTGVTLPDGRLWAHLDGDVLGGIVERTARPTDLHLHYRGSVAFDEATQLVERALFERHGWAWTEFIVDAVETTPAARGGTDVRLGWTAPDGRRGRAEATVGIGRTLPVPVCGEPLDAAVKSSRELVLERLEVED
jgi:hypothetical protein